MDNNTKNILYPKGSIFRMLESDVISSELEIARGAIVEAVSDIEVDDEYAEVCCNGETFIVGTDIMGIIPVKVSRENKSVKNDIIDDKLRWDLLPMEEIEDIVKVYHAGAKKYGPNKWQNLDNGFERYRAAAARHLMEYMKGERIDSDTGCFHLAQCAWNCIAMLWYDKHGKGLIPINKEEKEMTIEQLNYLLRKELYAIKNHKDNIDRIKKEYFDSNYGLKEGDKIRILHETGDEMIGFLKKVEVCEDGDLYLTIQKQNEKGDRGRRTWNMYLSSKSIKIEKCV